MATYNLSEMTEVIFNGTNLTEVYYNGVQVWVALRSVSISGTAEEGQTLTANVVPSNAPITAYQWFRGSTAINGATSKTYKVTNADRGYTLMVRAYIGNNFKQSANTAVAKGWRKITQNITLTNNTVRNFGVKIRKPQIYAKISVSCSGSEGTLQGGFGVFINGTEVGNPNSSSWNSTSHTYNDTFQVTNAKEGTQLKVSAWAACWGGSMSNARVNSSEFILRSWEQFD